MSRNVDTNADRVLDDLAARGIAIEVVGDRLRLDPASAVDDDLRARVAASKPEILVLLAERMDAVRLWRQAVELVAESLKIPPDVLEAAKNANVRWVPPSRLKDQ